MPIYGLTDYLLEVETDIAWREEEARAYDRLLSVQTDRTTIDGLRRGYITLMYAHAEGGVKTSLSCYIRVINAQSLSVSECVPSLAAAAWGDLFRALSDQSFKHDFFRSRLPDNTKLHRFARQAEFVGRIFDIEDLPIDINHEKIVDTESNLDAIVLTKILYQLGFPPDTISKKFDNLNFLRGLRNAIAHGEKTVPSEDQCKKYRKSVFELLPLLRDLLSKAIRQNSFKRITA